MQKLQKRIRRIHSKIIDLLSSDELPAGVRCELSKLAKVAHVLLEETIDDRDDRQVNQWHVRYLEVLSRIAAIFGNLF